MNNINFSLLETVRLLRQKTQKEVAEAVGISQSSLSKAEHGLQELPRDIMEKLCKYYDFPETFFMRSEGISPLGHLYYRKKLTVTNKIIDSFVAKVKIFKAIIDELMSAVELPEYTLGNYIPNENLSAKEIARNIRYKLKVFNGAVPNLSTLLENNGVIIIRIDFGTDKIDGLTTITDSDKKVMFINNQMPNDRIRFSMAHELGHLVMHLENPPCSSDDAERQADEFASEFLMPEEEIFPMLQNLNVQILGILKRKWRVSMHALVRRARDLDAITYQQYRNLQIYFSKKGYSRIEPIPLPVEHPTMWEETLNLYRNELGYTDEDLMSVMRINKADFINWFVCKPKVIPMNIFRMK